MMQSINYDYYDSLEYVERHLPHYYSRQDVFFSDILSRYLDGELDDERDIEWVEDECQERGITPAQLLLNNDIKLMQEAIAAAHQQMIHSSERRW